MQQPQQQQYLKTQLKPFSNYTTIVVVLNVAFIELQ